MDISTIKSPVEKTEGDQHASTPQGSDQAFLQLLAGLGLIQPIQPNLGDAGKLAIVNGGISLGLEAMPVAQDGSSATTAEQEMTAAGKIHDGSMLLASAIQTTQNVTAAEDLLAHVLMLAGKPESDRMATSSAGTVTVGTKDSSVIGQALTAELKPPLTVTPPPTIKGAPQSAPQTTTSKDVPQDLLTRLTDVLSSGHGLKEPGPAASASIGLSLNAAIQPAVGQDMSVKQTSASAQALVWDAVVESSNLLESGKDNNSASADHNGGKAQFPQAEPGASQAASMPAISSFSPQPSSVPARSSASVEAPTVTAPLESSLPASVRFEVQQGDMGRIRVHVSVVDHTVYTNVMTERIDAHDFLVKGSERYEAGLAAHGLDVGRFQVDVQGQGREHADRGAWSEEQTPRHREEPPNNAVTEWHAEERKADWEDRMVNVFA
jgi:hypothetical protein